jgi:hypothetical protein
LLVVLIFFYIHSFSTYLDMEISRCTAKAINPKKSKRTCNSEQRVHKVDACSKELLFSIGCFQFCFQGNCHAGFQSDIHARIRVGAFSHLAQDLCITPPSLANTRALRNTTSSHTLCTSQNNVS